LLSRHIKHRNSELVSFDAEIAQRLPLHARTRRHGMSPAGIARAAVLTFSGTCDETFTHVGKGISFKKPVNVFAPALIITGNRLRTPTASCTIKAVKPAGERRVLSLRCATGVAVEPVRALIGTSSDGSLVRYLNEQDSTGSSYKRCTL
jgi:hypothetical protein